MILPFVSMLASMLDPPVIDVKPPPVLVLAAAAHAGPRAPRFASLFDGGGRWIERRALRSVEMSDIAWSADGARLAYVEPDDVGGTLSWLEWETDRRVRLDGCAGAVAPTFCPDGATIVFTRWVDGEPELAWLDVEHRTVATGPPGFGARFDPTGRAVSFARLRDGRVELWIFDRRTGRERFVASTAWSPRAPSNVRWSSDGSWLYYTFITDTPTWTGHVRRAYIDGDRDEEITAGQHDRLVGLIERGRAILIARGATDSTRGITCVEVDLATGGERTRWRLPPDAPHWFRGLDPVRPARGRCVVEMLLADNERHVAVTLWTDAWHGGTRAFVIDLDGGAIVALGPQAYGISMAWRPTR